MIVSNNKVKKPGWKRTLWRYMDLPKFLDLVTTQQLFFVNCAKLSDRYEGEMPIKNIEQRKKALIKEHSLSESEAVSRAESEAETVREFKNYSLVNCWSAQPEESYALWKIYLGTSKEGVAIKTNARNLEQALKRSSDKIYMGEVSYADYIAESIDQLSVLTRKSIFYEYEQEVRLFMVSQMAVNPKYDPNQPLLTTNALKVRTMFMATHPVGKKIPIDIDTLIDKIYISPFAGEWFRDVLTTTMNKLNPALASKIVESEIRDR